jgi:hypothetical protein
MNFLRRAYAPTSTNDPDGYVEEREGGEGRRGGREGGRGRRETGVGERGESRRVSKLSMHAHLYSHVLIIPPSLPPFLFLLQGHGRRDAADDGAGPDQGHEAATAR